MKFFSGRADSEKVEAKGSGNLETATFAGGCFWCMQPPVIESEQIQGI
ncbi:MAG: hypothetical protein V1744_02870 [Candidatus Altiarchaeota archaeon]